MPITQFRMTGYNPDIPAHELADDHWSNVANMVPDRGVYSRSGGVFDHGTKTPDIAWLLNFQREDLDSANQLDNFWIYGGLSAGTTKIYLHEAIDGTDTDITLAGLHNSSRPDDWTGGILNGFPVVTVDPTRDNLGATDMQYWPGTDAGVPSTPDAMLSLPGQRANYNVGWLRPHRFHLFGGDTVSTANSHAADEVIWSTNAAVSSVPATWVPAANNEAGDVRLADSPGAVIDGISGPNARFYVFKHQAVYAAEYVGGNQIFSWRKLTEQVGVIGRHCAQVVGQLMYLLTPDDVVVFDGFQFRSICTNRTRKTIFDALYAASVNPWSAYLTYRPDADELWVCIPSPSQNYAFIAYVYDVQEDKWGVRLLENYGCGAYGIAHGSQYGKRALHMGKLAGKEIHQIDQNNTDSDGATGITWLAYKDDMTFGDRNRRKIVKRIWPYITTTGGSLSVSVQLGSRDSLAEAAAFTAAATFDPSVDQWVDNIISGKYISIRFNDTTVTRETVWGFDVEWEWDGAW